MKSLKFTMVFVLGLYILLSFGIIAVMSGTSISATGEALSEEQGIPIVKKVASLIDGDEFEHFLSVMDEEDEFYERIRLAMLDIKETVGCEYLYTIAPKSGSIWQYIIDGSCDPSDEENFSALGDEEEMAHLGEAPMRSFNEGIITNSGIVSQDAWGYQISTYMPIKNSRGKAVGLIGCDFNTYRTVNVMKQHITLIAIVSVILVIIGITVLYLIIRNIFGKMSEISDAMTAISEGTADLTSRIPERGNNELTHLAKSCNTVIGSLNSLIRTLQNETKVLGETGTTLQDRINNQMVNIIQTSTDNVGAIASRVSEQNGKIESFASEVETVESQITELDKLIANQSSAIQQSSSAITQISSNIQSVDKSISLITNEYKELVRESAEGRIMQDQVSEQIANIAQQSENLTEANQAIAAIAEQTNLLAMNAAIEAAHAGDLGKGFGVVADEIRALAETSSTQSSAIKQLLEGISGAIEGIVSSSVLSAQSFESVGNKITQLDNLMQEVQGGMREQSEGVTSILDSMKLLDSTTREITDASSRMKKAGRNMVSDIQNLNELSSKTQNESSSVNGDMVQLKEAASNAVDACHRNLSAADKISGLINGFTV